MADGLIGAVVCLGGINPLCWSGCAAVGEPQLSELSCQEKYERVVNRTWSSAVFIDHERSMTWHEQWTFFIGKSKHGTPQKSQCHIEVYQSFLGTRGVNNRPVSSAKSRPIYEEGDCSELEYRCDGNLLQLGFFQKKGGTVVARFTDPWAIFVQFSTSEMTPELQPQQ